MEIQKNQQQNLRELENLQDLILSLSDQPQLDAFGIRKLNPLKTLENRYTWTTLRTILEEAQVIGSALVHLKKQNGIANEDFRIGIVSSNTLQETILNFASIMYNITQVYIEDDLDTIEFSHFINKVDIKILFGKIDEIKKILATEKLDLLDSYVLNDNLDLQQNSQNFKNFDSLKEIGQQNRSSWENVNNDQIYGVFFDVTNQFQMVQKTQQQLLNDIKETQEKLRIDQIKSVQGTYTSLNSSANYFEHVFRFYNLLHLNNRVALRSEYQNYLTDLFLSQPTLIMANFSSNFSKIHKDQQNSKVNFENQKQKFLDNTDGFFKSLIKSLLYQQPFDQMKYNKVQQVVCVNQSSYHNIQQLLEQSVDISSANFQSIVHFLDFDGVYSKNDIEFQNCEQLNMKSQDQNGYICLKNKQQKIKTIQIGKIENDQIFVEGTVDDFITFNGKNYQNARKIESFYRDQNPHIIDIFVDVDSKTKKLVAIIDIHNLIQDLGLRKDQNSNEYLKKNTLQLLEEYRQKKNLNEELTISKIFIEQSGFRQKFLTDKFGNKKPQRFRTLYAKELEDLMLNKEQFYQFINKLFNENNSQ